MSRRSIKYFVEHYPGDNNPIHCSSPEEAIQTATRINGTAWRLETYHDRFGCPCSSYKRYISESGRWEYQ